MPGLNGESQDMVEVRVAGTKSPDWGLLGLIASATADSADTQRTRRGSFTPSTASIKNSVRSTGRQVTDPRRLRRGADKVGMAID